MNRKKRTKRQKWKKISLTVLQDDSLEARREWRGGRDAKRGRDTGEALCLGR